MDRPRLQFTIRRVMLATFWLGVCLAASAKVVQLGSSRPGSPIAIGFLCFPIAFISPCIAIGTLLGRTWHWTVIGASVIAALFTLLVLYGLAIS